MSDLALQNHQWVKGRCIGLLLATLAMAAGGCAVGVSGVPAAPSPGASVRPDRFLEASRAEHNKKVDWRPVVQLTFDTPAALDGTRVIEGQWEVRDGKLWAAGGAADRNRTILVWPAKWNPMRIEFEATLYPRPDGRVGDIAIRLNADPDSGSFAKGYALITAQYWNQATVCYRLNIPIARTEWSPIVPGRVHHVTAELTGNHLRLWVDGRVVLDAWDRGHPLEMSPSQWVGLSTYDTRMAIDNLTVSTAARAE